MLESFFETWRQATKDSCRKTVERKLGKMTDHEWEVFWASAQGEEPPPPPPHQQPQPNDNKQEAKE